MLRLIPSRVKRLCGECWDSGKGKDVRVVDSDDYVALCRACRARLGIGVLK